MKLKQKISVIIAGAAFLISCGIIETNTLGAFGLLGIVGAAVVIGGLDSKKTSMEQITRDYNL
jgi:hypothetical protein